MEKDIIEGTTLEPNKRQVKDCMGWMDGLNNIKTEQEQEAFETCRAHSPLQAAARRLF